MSREVVQRRSRGFICVNAHPEGCRVNIERQVATVKGQVSGGLAGPRSALVIGASTGYGLASRIAAAWGFSAKTLGIFFEREPEGSKTATAGWYNTAAFHALARRDGLLAASLNGDAFSNEIKRRTAEALRRDFGKLDLVVYSLASPKRTHPETGQVHNSVLKPVGAPYTNKTIELDSEKVVSVTLQPADTKEITDTIAVMGGDDWRRWMRLLLDEGLLAQGARTVAFSYIGPELTWPIYRDGTIGQAKKDLDATARALDELLQQRVGGRAAISVNKAVVTQASAAIPVVPLYMSILPGVMRRKGLDEGCIEQMARLATDYLASNKDGPRDAEGRIRLDDREMRADVQREVSEVWPQVTTENLRQLTDFAGFQREFRNLFGFDVAGVDYDQPVETEVRW